MSLYSIANFCVGSATSYCAIISISQASRPETEEGEGDAGLRSGEAEATAAEKGFKREKEEGDEAEREG